MKLRMSEFDENFSEDFAEGSEVITVYGSTLFINFLHGMSLKVKMCY